MQTSIRPRDAAHGASFAARTKGHAPHLSISDDSHHVTETIGFLYGDEDERDRRRASGAPSTTLRARYSAHAADNEGMASPQRTQFYRYATAESTPPATRTFEPSNGQQKPHPIRGYSFENGNNHIQTTTGSAREQSPQDVAQSHFPLNDIDYESSPAAVAQELSNLQALRRMSMVEGAAGDPDLPTLNPAAIPSAPSPTTSDDDAARLFWVPARLHPELAPKEFKTFLESKTEQIRRRSGDLSSLGSSSIASRHASLSSNSSDLSRKKSMLSREVNNASGYRDGADILDRKRSMSHQHRPSDPDLAELESLVANNIHVQRPSSPDENGDFILPSVPSSSLKRSTKTKYQRGGGGIKARGERQRVGKRTQTPDIESNDSSMSPLVDVPAQFSAFMSPGPAKLSDTLEFPASKAATSAQNFSRPAGRSPSPPDEVVHPIPSNTFDTIFSGSSAARSSVQSPTDPRARRKQMTGPERHIVPQIIETPPMEESASPTGPAAPAQSLDENQSQFSGPQQRHPARTSSREAPKTANRPSMPRTQSSASIIPYKSSQADVPPISNPKQSLEQPSPLPGHDTNTSNLSFIPTLTVDKQAQDKKDTKKSGWGWLGRGKDDDKEKGKNRTGRNAQSHDNTRLDVLQTSIDGNSRRRETIELDRDSLRLEEERKKESQRKSTSNEKKEKDGIFSSLFGGKRKAEKEAKKTSRGLSPEPRAQRDLKPDIDFSWTRFSILEERAIYRMAHIKLANPRRPLYSQVLLSNFMYSYLAKVQQMHPQMNLPTSAKQQKKQKEPSPPQQSEEFSNYQRYQKQQDHQHHPSQSSQQAQQHSTPVVHEGQYSSNGYESSNSRPSTRGSGRSAESGSHTSQHTNHSSHSQRSQHHQPVQQYETDRESEMW